jgi:hypothetical protein
MARFTLEIELGNAAMQTGEDVAHALRVAAAALEEVGCSRSSIWDVNGNRVGVWTLEAVESEES